MWISRVSSTPFVALGLCHLVSQLSASAEGKSPLENEVLRLAGAELILAVFDLGMDVPVPAA